MNTFGQRGDPIRLLGKRILLAILFLFVVAAVPGVWRAYKKERESFSLRREAEIQVEDLVKRKSQLEADTGKLNTPRGMEEALREQYLLAKEGENVIIIVESPTPAPIEATSSIMQWFQKTLPWW